MHRAGLAVVRARSRPESEAHAWLGQQLLRADEASAPGDENLKDLPLGRGECDGAVRPGSCESAASYVDDAGANPHFGCRADPACPPQHCPQACKEFGRVERPGDVVVRSCTQRRRLVRRAPSQLFHHREERPRCLTCYLERATPDLAEPGQRSAHDAATTVRSNGWQPGQGAAPLERGSGRAPGNTGQPFRSLSGRDDLACPLRLQAGPRRSWRCQPARGQPGRAPLNRTPANLPPNSFPDCLTRPMRIRACLCAFHTRCTSEALPAG